MKSYFTCGCLLAPLLFTVLIVLPSNGEAREWYAEPSVNIRSVYDDNIRLITRKKFVEEEYGVIASAMSKFGVRSEVMDISTEARVDLRRFTDDDLDAENFYLDLDSTFNVSERNRFDLDGIFIMDTSLTSELEDTGLTQVQVDRERKEITPRWTYLLSESQTIEASYTHNEVEYEDVSPFLRDGELIFNDLTDYRVDSVSLGYSHQWQPSTRYFVSLTALSSNVSDHDPDVVAGTVLFKVTDEEVDEYSLKFGFDHEFSETWTGSFMLGGRWTEDDFKLLGQREKNSKVGVLFLLSSRKQFESGFLEGGVSQSTRQTGQGDFKEIFKFKLSAEYWLSPRLKANLSGGVYLNSSAVINDDDDRTYFIVEPKLSWFFNRQTSVSGGYRFRRQEYDDDDRTAESNAFFVNLNYQWDKIATSRF